MGPRVGELSLTRAAAVVAAVHAHHGRPVPADLRAAPGAPAASAAAAGSAAVADLVGLGDGPAGTAFGATYESLLADEERTAGAHYTPSAVAAGLVTASGLGAASSGGRPPRVWDPSCGGGAFLLAAAEQLRAAGFDPAHIVDDLLWGTDFDPGAVAVTEAALVWWAAEHGAPEARPGDHLTVADTLLAEQPGPVEGFGLVVGNPPFQSQLSAGTARDADRRAALRARFGAGVGAYTDTAALFWLFAVEALAPGGAAVMVLPTSILSARDAAPVRAAIDAMADLVGLWAAYDAVFEAAVDVCAPVVRRRSEPWGPGSTSTPQERRDADGAVRPVSSRPSAVQRWRGVGFERLPDAPERPAASSWSPLLLASLGVPEPRYRSAGTLGERATATAGFRDEYYGLVPHVRDLDPGETGPPPGWSPLVTTGLVDVGACAWGHRTVRFARQRFDRPVVDRAAVEAGGGRAAAWLRVTGVPKLVVATQTRVGEAAVDIDGSWVPGTPLVAVLPRLPGRLDLMASEDPLDVVESLQPLDLVEELWRLAAVVCSPVGSAVALAQTAGSGRARHTIRPRVDTVEALPLPVDLQAWDEGAAALRARDQAAFAEAMAAAYAVADPAPLTDWWHPLAPWPTIPT